MIIWKNLRYEDTKSIVECEMTLEEYRFCESILAIENGKNFGKKFGKITHY
jgi:hypothetical protein